MYDQELVGFAQQLREQGLGEDAIKNALHARGVSAEDAAAIIKASGGVRSGLTGVGELLRQAWRVYADNFRLVLQVYGRWLLVVLALAVGFGAVAGFGYWGGNAGFLPDAVLAIGALILTVIGIIVVVYVMSWIQVAIINVVRHRNQHLDAKQLLEMSRATVGNYFWTSFLAGVLTLLWMLLLIIPGIIFGVFYSLATFIVVDQSLSGYPAIKRSREYIRGAWWPVFGRLLVLGLVAIVIFGILGAFTPSYYTTPNQDDPKGGVLSMIGNLIFMPFSTAYLYLLYEQLKSRKPELSSGLNESELRNPGQK